MEMSDKLTHKDKIDLANGQKIMTRMFEQFNNLCIKYNIQYWCIGGTLIGILRKDKIDEHGNHVGGWIPFDADIDIVMLEEDYVLFKSHIHELPNDVFLQDMETDTYYHIQNLAKLRNIHSHYIDYTPKGCHRGLQIDIFIWKKKDDVVYTHFFGQYRYDFIDVIFPLKQMMFENILVYVPNKYEEYAKRKCGGWPIPYYPKYKRYPHEGLINPYNAHKDDLVMYKHLYEQKT